MALLTADQIFKANPFRYDTAVVPEWGGELRLRSMTVAERQKFAKYLSDEGDDSGFIYWVCRVVTICAVTEDDKPLFADPDKAMDMLTNSPVFDATSLAETVVALNKIGDTAIEDEEKKS